MSLYITSLNSGSNGNCYYIANESEAVLVDVGISCREVERRMSRLGLSMNKVKAIFISHEHTDHIRGLEVVSRKYSLPVYITKGTLNNCRLNLEENLINSFKAYSEINIGKLIVTAFPKFHDAADPHSFIIEGNDTRIGVFTDIGTACKDVVKNFKQCHAVFLEANYDDEMLENGHYPFYLKKRIRSEHGHLSNKQALDLFLAHRHDSMSHILLSHLSKDNNCPKLAHELFEKHAGNTYITVASRYEESKVYHIKSNPLANVINRAKIFGSKADQMTLF